MKKKVEMKFVDDYKQYYGRLFLYVNKQLKDISLAEEIVQDIMIEYAEDVRSGKKIESVNAYLYGVARHKIADVYRKKKIKQIGMSALPEQLVNTCAAVLFQETVNQNDIRDKIVRILSKLPNDYALIIRLKYIEGMPVQQIAGSLSMSFKSVESMLFRARKLFARMYKSA